MHLTQVHQRKCFHLIHKSYTCSESTGMSFNTKQQVLAPSLVLYSSAAWTQLPIRRSGNPRHSWSSELPSSSLFKFFYISKIISLFQNYSPLCCLIYLLIICSPPYTLFYPLYCPQNCLSFHSDFWSVLLQRSVASSRSFSKTFSADLIRSRIRRLSTLMLAAAISIPAHSSKESHAIFMQYWWGVVTPSQLIHSYPEL